MRRKDREATDINAIREIMDKCRTVSVAMVDNGEPYVIPLSYGYELTYTENPCNAGYFYSSVAGNGTAEFVEDAAGKRRALANIFAHQTGTNAEFTEAQAKTVCVLKIVAKDYTGKQKK